MEQDRIIDPLNNLTEFFILSDEMFRQAIKHAQSAELKNLLEEEEIKHGTILRELQAEVEHFGGTPKSQGTVAGSFPDLWRSLDKLFKTDDRNKLALLEENEDRLVVSFKGLLDEPLPAELREFLQLRYGQILDSHERIRNLRDNSKYAVKSA